LSLYPDKVCVSNELQQLFDFSDYNVCNFEAPVNSNGKKILKSGPNLCQPVESVELLKKMNFNIFLMANNHMLDYDISGADATLKALSDCICIGYGTGSDAYKFASIVINNKKIGLLSIVQKEFGVVDYYENTKKGTAWINSDIIPKLIIDTKKDHDFILVFPHAGLEEIDAPLPQWRKKYKSLIDYGADVVIASHPHVPQGWEEYMGKPIFYSLGNFCFDIEGNSEYWNTSLCVKLTVSDKINYQVYSLSYKDHVLAIDNSKKKHIEYLNNLLTNNTLYTQYINDSCRRLYKSYRYQILKSNKGYSILHSFKLTIKLFVFLFVKKSGIIDLFNTFQCESHRWAIENYLANQLMGKKNKTNKQTE
jgi:poly-gamma-glutamate synthesis protein (capsule biosynthesis protein)